MGNQSISEKLFQMAIDRSVSEKLNGLTREFGNLTKNMSEADKKAATITLLGMVEIACSDFFTKMKARLESKSV